MNDHDWAHIDDGAYEDEGPFAKWAREQVSSRHTQTDDEARRRFKEKTFKEMYGGNVRAQSALPPGTYEVEQHVSIDPASSSFIIHGTRTGRIGPPMDFTLADRIEALQRQREEQKKVEAFLATLPPEPMMRDQINDDEPGSHLTPVVYFVHQFKGTDKKYQYAALKCTDGLWYTTGPKSPKGYSWHELLLWLLESSHDTKLPPIVSSYIEDWRDLTDVSNA